MQLGEQADAQLQAGNIGFARYSIDAALKERDDIPTLHILKGRIAIAQNDRETAFAAYSSASGLDATNMEALQGVTQLGLSIGRWEEAKAAADKILVIQPTEPGALFAKGLISLSEHRVDDAMRLADSILTGNPRDTRGLILKARALFTRRQVDAALETLDKGTAGGEREDPIVATYLELHRVKSDAAAMLTDLVSLERMRPDDARVRLDLANLRYKTGDVAGARDVLSRLLARRDTTAATMTRIVAIWQQYDRDPIARDALATTPFGTGRARIETARYFLDSGRPNDALAILGGATAEDAKALAARAQLAAGADPAGPAAAAAAILSRDVTQCDALVVRASIALRRGNVRPAITDSQRAVAECPTNSGGYRSLAAAERAEGDRSGEYRAYDAALTALPQDVTIAREYYDRAKALGDANRMAAVARQVTRSMPSWPGSWTMLVSACAAIRDTTCRQDAEYRASAVRTSYRLDPLPGEAPARGLQGSMR